MNQPSIGRVCAVTGGASGIGLASVLRFLRDGASVVAADLNPTSIENLLAKAGEEGCADRLRVVRADVSKEDDVRGMIETAVSAFGRLDCLFNNAGVGGAFGPVTELEAEDWDYTFSILVRGVFLGTKHGARVMRTQERGGSIINTASIAGLSGGAGALAYSSAKAAVINMTRAASLELAPFRIRVNCICPGFIVTPMVHRGREAATIEQARGLQPWPDHGRPEHIASAAAFLASEDAEFITGHSLVVDGGRTAAGPGLSEMHTRPETRDLVGVNKGTTGERAIVRNRAEKDGDTPS